MKLLIAITMMFLIVSCSAEEDTTLRDQINDYEKSIISLENELKEIKNSVQDLESLELRILSLEQNLKVLTEKVDSNKGNEYLLCLIDKLDNDINILFTGYSKDFFNLPVNCEDLK
jgi:peptidoglycan hydrolase CwlO-like protein